MYRTLRIIFCILAVLIAAAAIFIFVYLGWQWGLVANEHKWNWSRLSCVEGNRKDTEK